MDKVKEINFPNLEGLAKGTMSGHVCEWPQLKEEAEELLSLLSEKEKYTLKLLDEGTDFYTQKCKAEARVRGLEKKVEELDILRCKTEEERDNLWIRIKSLEEGIEKHRWEKWGYGEDMKEGRFYQVEDELDEELYNLIKGGKNDTI